MKKFLPHFPDLIGTALLNYFGDLRANVKKLVDRAVVIAKEVKKKTKEMKNALAKGQDVKRDITEMQIKFTDLAKKLDEAFGFTNPNFGKAMRKYAKVAMTSRAGINSAMNTVGNTVKKFEDMQKLTEEWAKGLIKAKD